MFVHIFFWNLWDDCDQVILIILLNNIYIIYKE